MRTSFMNKIGLLLGGLAAGVLPAGSAHLADATSPASRPRVILLVVDGLEPETVTPLLTPNLWGLVEAGDGRRYSGAKATMIAETNSNHTAMLTGAYPDTSGLVSNAFFNARSGVKEALERPSQILVPTLFDAIEEQKPSLRTASIMGKEKLRRLFDCTKIASGTCGPSADNPEQKEVNHRRPDFIGGASSSFDPDAFHDDAVAEPATSSGYSLDNETMDIAISKATSSTPPDFSFINLSVVDGFQHLFGARTVEGLAAVANADANIGRLVTALKDAGTWDKTVLFVLADHSFQESGDSVGPGPVTVKNPVTPNLVGTQLVLSDLLGTCEGTPFATVSHGGAASVYLRTPGYNPYAGSSLSPDQKACLTQLRGRALARKGVSEALFRVSPNDDLSTTIAGAHPEWRLDSPRIGELLLIADDRSSFLETRSSTHVINTGVHGGPSTLPVPFIVASGSSMLLAGVDDSSPVRPMDVAPTIAWLLGINPPSASEGRILCEAFSACP